MEKITTEKNTELIDEQDEVVKVDGRKKPRTEKQIEALKTMRNAPRKKKIEKEVKESIKFDDDDNNNRKTTIINNYYGYQQPPNYQQPPPEPRPSPPVQLEKKVLVEPVKVPQVVKLEFA
jgi:hypothetical protein